MGLLPAATLIFATLALAGQVARDRLRGRKGPAEGDVCYATLLSDEAREHFVEDFGVELVHEFGHVYSFDCLSGTGYKPPLSAAGLSEEEEALEAERYNKKYIKRIALESEAEDIMYGAIKYKVAPLDYTRPSTKSTQYLWHLSSNFGSKLSNLVNPSSQVDVESAWENGLSGKGVTILIVDDGLCISHEDFTGRINTDLNMNFCSSSNDPTPTTKDDTHGTSVAGVAAGGMADEICAIGPSYEATLAGRNALCNSGSLTMEILRKSLICDTCELINNSWGEVLCPTKLKECVYDSTTSSISELLEHSATNGRGNLGSILTFASGNEGHIGEYSSMHEFSRSFYTLTVGAVEASGVVSNYSCPGPAVDVSAPSNGYGTDKRTPVHIYSSKYGTSECESNFGGTSSATPLVSGIIGLMLQENSNLTFRDIRYIFVHFLKVIDTRNSELSLVSGSVNNYWIENAYGAVHNVYYGFGMADAELLTEAAANWVPVDSLVVYKHEADSIKDGSGKNSSGHAQTTNPTVVGKFIVTEDIVTSQKTVPQYVESVAVAIKIRPENKVNITGNINVIIESPQKTQSLVVVPFDIIPEEVEYYTIDVDNLTSHQFFGEPILGTWTVTVKFLDSKNVSDYVTIGEMTFYGVRNKLSITSPTWGESMYNNCYSISLSVKSDTSNDTQSYKGYLAAITNKYTSSKPMSPANSWKIIKELSTYNEDGKITTKDGKQTLTFIIPSEVATYNYTKYRIAVVPEGVNFNDMMLMGGYNDVSRSPVFTFTSIPTSTCETLVKDVTVPNKVDIDTVRQINNSNSGCLTISESNMDSFVFRTTSSATTGITYNSTFRVPVDQNGNSETVTCSTRTSTALETLKVNDLECKSYIVLDCGTTNSMSLVEQFSTVALDNKINNLAINSKSVQTDYTFNLLKFDVANFSLAGNFNSLLITNATITSLEVSGKAYPTGTNNVLDLSNSTIDSATLTNMSQITINRCTVKSLSITNTKNADIFINNVPSPRGFCGKIEYSGRLTYNGKILSNRNDTLDLSNSCIGTPSTEEGTWSISVTSGIVINTLV